MTSFLESFHRKTVVCLVPKKYINTQVPRALAARGLVIVQDIHRAGGSHAHQFVLTEDLGNAGSLLRLDLITDYGPSGQILYAADDLLKSRQRREGFWALSPDLQFICYLVKKVIKGDLDGLRERRLSAFYNHDPDGCRRELERCLGWLEREIANERGREWRLEPDPRAPTLSEVGALAALDSTRTLRNAVPVPA